MDVSNRNGEFVVSLL